MINLQQNIQQTTLMSTQMIQAINVLAMNNEELQEFIEEQWLENPIIEIGNFYEKKEVPEIPIVNMKNYYDYLLMQWDEEVHKTLDKQIGEWLILNTDEKGYLDVELIEVAQKFDVTLTQIEQVLVDVQTLEPTGVCTRNLEERLILQLKQKNINDKKIYTLIKNNLKAIINKKWSDIMKKEKLEQDELKRFLEIMSDLQPYIDLKTDDKIHFIQPELQVVKNINGIYEVEYINDLVPKVSINNYYRNLSDTNIDDNSKKYVRNKFDQAVWLIKNIEERRKNVLNVSKYIMHIQRDFLDSGIKYLKPLTQEEVANELELSISTVHRVVNGKFIDTPQGIYELKYFFSGGMQKQNKSISTKVIKEYMKEIIDKENKRKPLSDEKIMRKLKDQGIAISRRTIAKYRDSLRIPNASLRKEL